MSDPLSVAASVVGLLTAAAQISLIPTNIISEARHAPQECKRIRSEVDDIRNVLQQLSLYTNGTKQASWSRRALIMVDQVAATLASCITTFDELKLFVEALQSDTTMGLLDRLRWTTKTTELKQLLARLDTYKSSLTLMLTILTCQKQDDAEDKVDHLCNMVELLLKQNTILAQRMLAFDMSNVGMTQSQAQLAMALPGAVCWNSSAISGSPPYGAGIHQPLSTGPGLPIPSDPNSAKRNTRGFTFEELLMNSRAYRNAARNNTDAFSVATSAGRTATWSMLSGISLSEMSNIAILALPVYEVDLNDKNIYNFEPPRTEDLNTLPSSDLTRPENVSSSSHRRVKDWWKSINKTDQSRTSPLAISADPEQHIFDVALAESIRHANVAISLTDEQGEAFIYGYIPIIVAKVCVYLKEKGIDVPEVFAHNGNALRVQRLYTAFGLSPRYGKGLDWTRYTVADAATIMLRYLKSLPEPIVPFAFYTRFTEPLRQLAVSSNLDVDSGKHEEVAKITRAS